MRTAFAPPRSVVRGPLAIANKHLPLPLEELLAPGGRWKVAHSTKVGLAGESEQAIREAARAARLAWRASRLRGRRAAQDAMQRRTAENTQKGEIPDYRALNRTVIGPGYLTDSGAMR